MEITRAGNKPVTDLRGQKYGRLTVKDYLGKGKHNKHYWKCHCRTATKQGYLSIG